MFSLTVKPGAGTHGGVFRKYLLSSPRWALPAGPSRQPGPAPQSCLFAVAGEMYAVAPPHTHTYTPHSRAAGSSAVWGLLHPMSATGPQPPASPSLRTVASGSSCGSFSVRHVLGVGLPPSLSLKAPSKYFSDFLKLLLLPVFLNLFFYCMFFHDHLVPLPPQSPHCRWCPWALFLFPLIPPPPTPQLSISLPLPPRLTLTFWPTARRASTTVESGPGEPGCLPSKVGETSAPTLVSLLWVTLWETDAAKKESEGR